MGLFRQTLVWLCSTLLIASGLFGQGVVLCLPRGEAARLEVSGDDGRCLGNRQHPITVRSAKPEQAGLHASPPHDHGCEDIAVAGLSARSPAWDDDSLKTAPVVVTAGVPPRHDTAALQDLAPLKRLWPPGPPFRDILSVRTTVALLI